MGAICEIIREDGEMARLDDLIPFAEKHNLKIITIEALIHWRRKETPCPSLFLKHSYRQSMVNLKL